MSKGSAVAKVEKTADKIGGALARVDELRHLIPNIGDARVADAVHAIVQAMQEVREILADVLQLKEHMQEAATAMKGQK